MNNTIASRYLPMSYQLKRKEKTSRGLQRIANEQLDKALEGVHRRGLKKASQVHQVRKRCKKLRGLLRLFRSSLEDTYQEENAALRDASSLLSEARDAKVLIDSYDLLMEHFEDQVDRQAFGSIRRKLTWQRKNLFKEEPNVDARLDEVAKRLRKIRRRVKKWEIEDKDFQAIQSGLGRTYRRARSAMEKAYKKRTAEAFHEWRKRVKYHWYHMRLLAGIWPKPVEARAKEAHRLGDLLGDDHDLAVLRSHLASDPQEYGKKRDVQAFIALIDRRRKQLQHACRPLGERLLAEKKSAHVHRMEKYWAVWKSS